MDCTVREHINRLKSRIDLLTRELVNDLATKDELQGLRTEVGIAFLALAHFEAALREETKLSARVERAQELS